MMEYPGPTEDLQNAAEDELAQPGHRLAAFVRRMVLALLAGVVILSLLSNLTGLPETINSSAVSDIGLSDSEIIDRYGQPDSRSNIQEYENSGDRTLGPMRLDPGDRYYSLIFKEGPLYLVFHLVSPDTYLKHNAYRVDGQEWVVLERFIGTNNVFY